SPAQFVEQILAGKLGVKTVVVGDNFRFGHRQAGNTQVLQDLGERFGFTTEIIGAVTVRGTLVSSSALRRLVEAGHVARAARLLGSLEGESPRRIRVSFLWRLRDERKFESPEALKAQILRDAGRARAYFRRLERFAAIQA